MTIAPRPATDDRSSGSLSGLTARVAYTDEQIKQLRGDFTSFKDSVGMQFDRSREQNAQAIGEMNSNVARQIERLGSELREQGKTKGTNWIGVWGVAFAAVGALVILAGAILSPINGSIGDTKISFEHVANTFEKINEQFARRDDIREDGKRRDATINKIEERLAGIEQNFVTRPEHSEFKARLDQSSTLEARIPGSRSGGDQPAPRRDRGSSSSGRRSPRCWAIWQRKSPPTNTRSTIWRESSERPMASAMN